MLLGSAILLGFAIVSGQAQTLSWSTPLGTVTVFGSGPRTSYLQTQAQLADVDAAETLNYLDAPSSPATSRSEALTSNGSFTSLAQVAIDESQTSGLPYTSGSIGFSSLGSGQGTGEGLIKVFFLINVPDPVTIDLSGIRSEVTTLATPADAFSLKLFESDADGAIIGSALLSFAGNMFDDGGQYQTKGQYYLVEMDASAKATATFAESVSFSFALDLAPIPEPASTGLMVAGGLSLAGLARWRKLHTTAKGGS
jgi:hypothetical protein